jgi:hypothetical protein
LSAAGEGPVPQSRRNAFGCARGKLWISDDFYAPLREFEEYMK